MKLERIILLIALVVSLVAVVLLIGSGNLTILDYGKPKLSVTEMISSLEEMQGALNALHKGVSDNMVLIEDIGEESLKSVINSELEIVDKQIVTTNEEIGNLINDIYSTIENKNETSYTDLLERYSNIAGGMNIVTDNIENLNNQIANEIEYLSASSSGKSNNTISVLNVVRDNLAKSNLEFESNVNNSFDAVNKNFAAMKMLNEKGFETIKDMFDSSNQFNTQTMTANQDTVITKMDTQYNSLIDSISNNNALFSVKLDSDFHILNQSFNDFEDIIKSQINTLSGSISNDQTDLEEKLATYQSALEAKIENAQLVIEGKIEKQTASIEGAINGQTTSIEGAIDGQTSTIESAINGQFKNIEESLKGQTTNIEDELKGQNSVMQEKLANVSGIVNTISSNQTDILSVINANANAIGINKEAINGIEAHLESQDDYMKTVFQHASSGKLMLQATLNNLNIAGISYSVAEPDTFFNINEGIKKAYSQGFNDGIANVSSPMITYNYHDHATCGFTTSQHDSIGELSDTQFGCYQIYSKHTHSWEENCFKYTSHSHTSACGWRSTCTGGVYCQKPDGHEGNHEGYCNCGNWVSFTGWNGDARCGNGEYTTCLGILNSGQVTICQKDTSAHYSPNCGYKDNEIERVIIEYK